MKYDFYKIRNDFKAGKPLPSDVNQYFKTKLESLKLLSPKVLSFIEQKEKCGNFGQISIMDTRNPLRHIELNFRWGILVFVDMIEEIIEEQNVIGVSKNRIKNPNINTNHSFDDDK